MAFVAGCTCFGNRCVGSRLCPVLDGTWFVDIKGRISICWQAAVRAPALLKNLIKTQRFKDRTPRTSPSLLVVLHGARCSCGHRVRWNQDLREKLTTSIGNKKIMRGPGSENVATAHVAMDSGD